MPKSTQNMDHRNFYTQMVSEVDKNENNLFNDLIHTLEDLHEALNHYSVPQELMDKVKLLPETLKESEQQHELWTHDDMDFIFEGLKTKLFAKLPKEVASQDEVVQLRVKLLAMEEENRAVPWLQERFIQCTGLKNLESVFDGRKLNLHGIEQVTNMFAENWEKLSKFAKQKQPNTTMHRLTELQMDTKAVQHDLSSRVQLKMDEWNSKMGKKPMDDEPSSTPRI